MGDRGGEPPFSLNGACMWLNLASHHWRVITTDDIERLKGLHDYREAECCELLSGGRLIQPVVALLMRCIADAGARLCGEGGQMLGRGCSLAG